MASSQRPKGRNEVASALDLFIRALNLARETCGIPPANVAFGSAIILLTMIRDTMANDQDYVALGRTCAIVCQSLYRRLEGRRLAELNQSVLNAIGELNKTVAKIQRTVAKRGERGAGSRSVHAMDDKRKIAAWKQDFARVLQVFNTELVVNTRTIVADIQRQLSMGGEGTSDQNRSFAPAPGPTPPESRIHSRLPQDGRLLSTHMTTAVPSGQLGGDRRARPCRNSDAKRPYLAEPTPDPSPVHFTPLNNRTHYHPPRDGRTRLLTTSANGSLAYPEQWQNTSQSRRPTREDEVQASDHKTMVVRGSQLRGDRGDRVRRSSDAQRPNSVH